MFKLSVIQNFCAAHFLRGYKGKCQNLHGHNWKVEIILKSDKLNDIGMVKDFKEIKNKLKNVVEQFDHTCLNNHEVFKEGRLNPTCEYIALQIHLEFFRDPEYLDILSSVKVWENENSYVEYF